MVIRRFRRELKAGPTWGKRLYVLKSIAYDLEHERAVGERAMNEVLPIVHLARHGETAWSLTGQHTGLTDLPLTERGEWNARRLGRRLRGLTFAAVFASPLQRAMRTCELAGFRDTVEVDPDLVEWNYGDYEGRRTADIQIERPGWQLFRDGCPGGETVEDVCRRADRIVDRVRATQGNVLIFSSGHILRVMTARWLGLKPGAGKYLLLSTASLSALGYDHDISQPVIRFWNDTDCDRHRRSIPIPKLETSELIK